MQKAKLQHTTVAKTGQVDQEWFIVSAQNQVLGRLAVKVAMILMGKNKPEYTAHVDTGDFVIITDAEKIGISGTKAETKEYDYYTNHSGGHKYVKYADAMAKKPEWVITEAVRRMLPKNKIGTKMLTKLKVYKGSEHPHAAQMPKEIN
ncbi:MAG: 50S ribosomal protein L13 [Phycisphaerae bacterium]|nr:50S ribosomal protein L13 [Phycisphaerae bacterium]